MDVLFGRLGCSFCVISRLADYSGLVLELKVLVVSSLVSLVVCLAEVGDLGPLVLKYVLFVVV